MFFSSLSSFTFARKQHFSSLANLICVAKLISITWKHIKDSISHDSIHFHNIHIHPSCTLCNPIRLTQMHTLMQISAYVCTHSRDQYTPTPSHCKDKTSRSLTYTLTEYQSYSEESLFASPRMFLSQNIKGL